MTGHPPSELFGEVAFIAYHFHWPYDEIMRLEHGERRLWVREISELNERANREPGGAEPWR